MIDIYSNICPIKSDLIPAVDEIEDQLLYPICTGNAIAAMLEIQASRAHDKYGSPLLDLSRMYPFHWAQNFDARIGAPGANSEHRRRFFNRSENLHNISAGGNNG